MSNPHVGTLLCIVTALGVKLWVKIADLERRLQIVEMRQRHEMPSDAGSVSRDLDTMDDTPVQMHQVKTPQCSEDEEWFGVQDLHIAEARSLQYCPKQQELPHVSKLV